MIQRNGPKPTLPRPPRCKKCGVAVVWDTAYIQGKRIDSYRCINGHSSEDGEIGVRAVVEKQMD